MRTVTYVKTGLPGYGPDLDESDIGNDPDDMRGICEMIRYELDALIDIVDGNAEADAEAGDYESAWKTRKRADELVTLRANLDYDKRATAPLYVDDPPKLDATMRDIIADTFPLDVTDQLRLYVWDADDDQDV